ncbi:hypothetical protein SESBI_40310 [Sesbania bispinosa]|nr:hypothetical protein SESBI_40310 [Sesbania bispinosa]
MVHKLRSSVIFLPLKDLRYAQAAQQGHTWFMSSMNDTHEDGEVQYQQFPSESSQGRLLCLKGHDIHDGSWNSYALAWPEALPYNTTFMKGLTFVSYNHYSYENLWHGLSAMVPFVAWHKMNNYSLPSRWVLYHRGELRFNMGLWLGTLMEATFNGPPIIERFDGVDNDGPVCFEEAMVMRHNEGGMSRERRIEVYDLMRWPRSFKNETIVAEIFHKECAKIEGCRFMVAHSNNLTFCEQVGLKLAGVGQYVYHWIASWSGMKHQGSWRDPNGDECPYSEDDRRCMTIYKSGRIGHNETHFAEWARNVLVEVKARKIQEASIKSKATSSFGCACS